MAITITPVAASGSGGVQQTYPLKHGEARLGAIYDLSGYRECFSSYVVHDLDLESNLSQLLNQLPFDPSAKFLVTICLLLNRLLPYLDLVIFHLCLQACHGELASSLHLLRREVFIINHFFQLKFGLCLLMPSQDSLQVL